ncbi:MAG TPA: Ig-like domain repeat protein [Gemmataceae bacterium]|nr:Ig-like domain repeat protein [Gemmataceae bacterium]
MEDRYLLSTLTVLNNLDDGSSGSLRAEIAVANSGDTITFDQSLSGTTINLDPAKGELFINKDLNIVGLGAANLAISGQNQTRVLEFGNYYGTDTVSGLTIENGIPNDNYPGGGILIDGATVTVSGCTLSNDSAGAIYNTDSTLTVSGCTLSNNRGGGIRSVSSLGTLTVSDCTLTDNSAPGNSWGGGIFTGGTATVSGSKFFSNSAYGPGGGIENLGTMTVSDCTFSNNSAAQGGGISNLNPYDPTSLTVSGCTFTNNSALFGGAIFNGFYSSQVDISNSTLSNNSAVYQGGGIFNVSGCTVNVTDSTVCGNTAPWGADISNFGTETLTNSDVCIINQFSTTTTVTSSNSSSVFGQGVTFTAAVVAPAGASPTGTVSFFLDGSTPLATSTLNSSGQATLTTAGLSVGAHTITAVYSGDANNAGSTSAALSQTVLSAQQELSVIITQVQTMVTNGVLDSGNANALITKLNNAITSLNSGNTITGDNQLNAFINQTNAFVQSGKLDSTDAQTLVSDIDLAIGATLVKPI